MTGHDRQPVIAASAPAFLRFSKVYHSAPEGERDKMAEPVLE
jgi:hypothetical protein